MSEFARYEAYKDSGVEWLGEIPEHWNLKKIKFFVNEIESGKREQTDLKEVLSIGGEHIQKEQVQLNKPRYVSMKFFNSFKKGKLQPNDILLVKDGATIGKVGYFYGEIEQPVLINEHLYRISSERYIFYILQSWFSQYYFRSRNNSSAQEGLTLNTIKNLYFFQPPAEIRCKITKFLDQKTTEIDEAIAKKQRLIELLKEQKTILINQAVTKGLNPNVTMRDSGVEWIGDIPAHWQVKKLRFLGKTQNGISAGAEYFGSGYPFVSYSDVYNNLELPKEIKGLAQSTEQDRKQYSIEKGDVLFTRTSETVEEIAYSSVCTETINNSTFAGFLIRFRPQKNILEPMYSKYFFSARIHRNYFVKEMNLVIRASLSQDLLKNLPVLLPPPNEQKQIALYCSDISKAIEQIINNERLAIEKLNEFKQTLIAHAVTGKIKV